MHSEAHAPTVHVHIFDTGLVNRQLGIEIRDTNPQIPAMEIEAMQSGGETPLQHGQGIGFWIAYWCLSMLNAEVDFDYEDGNIITMRIPNRSDD